MSSFKKVSNNLKDDGPKLREEKHFSDFYPDLDQQELLPVIVPNEKDNCCETGPRKDEKVAVLKRFDSDRENAVEYAKNGQKTHIKQMIFNDKVTLEPIALDKSQVRFKKCKLSIGNLVQDPRVSRTYQRFGYMTGSSLNNFDENTSPYIKRTDDLALAKPNPLKHISRYQSNFKVEYDMDEQDDLYLRYLNEIRISNPTHYLTHEIFEIVMSVLENEWFHLEKKIPPRISTTSEVSSQETRAAWAHYESYGSDDGTGHVVDQPCAVCGLTECDNSNAIVFCDGCDVAVHQECYGVVFIPEGQWLCRRCMISRNRKINCLFCPSHTGAFKQTDRGSWGHVVCGLWIPELFFVNSHYMEPIDGIDMIPRSRWKLTCYICKQKVGACIQCSNKNCFTAFHVTCAKRAGLCMDFGSCSIVEASSNAPGVRLQSFCDKHSPPDWPDCKEGIAKTRNYFAAANNRTESDDTPLREKQSTSVAKGKWTTNRGTPIAPQVFARVVEQVLEIFKVENSSKLSTDLCKYWSMKRELKRGAPLVRKFDPSSFGAFTVDEINRRVEFAQVLSNDMKKLHDMTNLVVERQKALSLRDGAVRKARELYSHPGKFFLRETVMKKVNNYSSYRALMQEKKTRDGFNRQIQIFLESKTDDDDDCIALFRDLMESYFAEVEDDEKASRRIKGEAKKLQAHVHVLLESVEFSQVKKWIAQDFTNRNGDIKPVPWKGPLLMKEYEIDEIEELSHAETKMLWAKLGGR
ncbi:LAME_0E03092g1_1 [Lachancea meyersii CBS 8951]|uniref:LAME_0E03092g1_1 n=1 Tax=Lachancea meyersii CBS 8951 TaxID=1266667 RepID=A0A1G4JGV3_9SACH|nr:LAME_0E03092g1_1 [Lachancea meyersii CBS 8951]